VVDGMQIVGWLSFCFISASLIVYLLLLIRSKNPKMTFGPGAGAYPWLYGAVLVQSLNLVLRYRSTWLSWFLLALQVIFLLMFFVKLGPLFIQHLRDTGLMSKKRK
jgi:hypothetical protein